MENEEFVESSYDDKQVIILDQMNLSEVPIFLISNTKFPIAASVDISYNQLLEIPDSFFSNFPNLCSLILNNNKLIRMPESITFLNTLQILKLDNNQIRIVPKSIGNLRRLEIFSISRNNLISIPNTIGNLQSTLRILNISYNKIKYLPTELGCLNKLTELQIQNNHFSSIPTSIHNLSNLKVFALEWGEYLLSMNNEKSNFFKIQAVCKDLAMKNASTCSFMDFLKFYSFNGSYVNLYDTGKDSTPIHKAVCKNNIPILKLFLSLNKYAINVLDSHCTSLLYVAIDTGNVESAEVLLDEGAIVDVGNELVGTPLSLAIDRFDIKLIKRIIKQSNVNYGSPLHALMSVFYKSPHKAAIIGEILINTGAKLNEYNKSGWCATHIAAKASDPSAVQWIIQYNKQTTNTKFDLNSFSLTTRHTPLHIAAHFGSFATAQILVNEGADIMALNMQDKLPRHMARGHLALYKYLRRVEQTIIKKKIITKKMTCDSLETSYTVNAMNCRHASLMNMEEFFVGNKMLSDSASFKDIAQIKVPKKKFGADCASLRVTVLNNKLPLFERYYALNLLLWHKDKKNKLKEIKLLLAKFPLIESNVLQIHIIRSVIWILDNTGKQQLKNLGSKIQKKVILCELTNILKEGNTIMSFNKN